MGNLGVQKLFDRLIDFTLITKPSEFVSAGSRNIVFKCPRTGIKPDISLKGSFAANIVYNAELRIKNFYSPINLDPGDGTPGYKWIHIDAGYKNSLEAAMDGQIWTAYQTAPPPDGDTIFSFFTGWFTEWVSAPFARNYDEGTSINTILRDVCDSASQINPNLFTVTLDSALSDFIGCSSKIDENTTIGNFCTKLARNENLVIQPADNTLRVFSKNFADKGTGRIHKPEFISDIKKTAAGYTVTAPWIPSVRPGDSLYIDPRYYSSDVSGMFVKLAPNLLVITVDFEFETVGSTNRMVVTTVGEQQ